MRVDLGAGKSTPELITDYQQTLDLFVDEVRSRFPAAGRFMSDEYRLTGEQAQAFADGGYAGAAPETVQAWADASGMSVSQACDDILAARAQYEQVLAATRTIRLAGKAAIAQAATPRNAYDALHYYKAQADAIKP